VNSSTSRTELESLATQWISLWCVPVDWKLFDRLHAEGFEDCSAAGRAPTKQGFADGLRELVRAFPDLQTRVEQLVVDVENSCVAVRWSARGTNKANFLGIGPTERLTSITGIEIIEIKKSQIVRRWGEWDISAHTAGINPQA
jgi:steroid delta-isomerase-like uncharacterized protein